MSFLSFSHSLLPCADNYDSVLKYDAVEVKRSFALTTYDIRVKGLLCPYFFLQLQDDSETCRKQDEDQRMSLKGFHYKKESRKH